MGLSSLAERRVVMWALYFRSRSVKQSSVLLSNRGHVYKCLDLVQAGLMILNVLKLTEKRQLSFTGALLVFIWLAEEIFKLGFINCL